MKNIYSFLAKAEFRETLQSLKQHKYKLAYYSSSHSTLMFEITSKVDHSKLYLTLFGVSYVCTPMMWSGSVFQVGSSGMGEEIMSAYNENVVFLGTNLTLFIDEPGCIVRLVCAYATICDTQDPDPVIYVPFVPYAPQ